MLNKIIYYLKNPRKLIIALAEKRIIFLTDKTFLKLVYRERLGKKLNLKNPQTFNEKIQWLKLYDRKDVYTTMVDKYEVKNYVANIIGEEYIIPTLGVYEKFEDIDFDKLPNQFVLKCTHDSGGNYICKDKSKMDIDTVRDKINKSLKTNYYLHGREWPYKNVKPRIIAEKYMEDGNRIVPEDYKIYCMNGKPKYIVVFHNRYNDDKELSETVYDTNWKKQNFSFDEHFAISDIVEPKPNCLDELLGLTEKLAKGHPQLRVDFYIINGKVYFGEITFYTAGGFQPMIPREMDEIVGKLIDLPVNKGRGK